MREKTYLFFIIVIVASFSCNLGLRSGADLAGTWYAEDLLGILRWTFETDNTGEFRSFYIKSDTFTWDITQAGIYNVVIVDWDDDLKTREYLYYFNPDKSKLYMKNRYNEDEFWKEYTDQEVTWESIFGL